MFHIETIIGEAMKNLLFLFVVATALHGYAGEQTPDLGDSESIAEQEISGLTYDAAFEQVTEVVPGIAPATVKKLIRIAYTPNDRLFDRDQLNRLVKVVQWKVFQKGQQLVQANERQAIEAAANVVTDPEQEI
jgi:hypothetical protein